MSDQKRLRCDCKTAACALCKAIECSLISALTRPFRRSLAFTPRNRFTHVEALELDRLPSHLIVLGGGYVGLEFAQAFVRFGSRVSVLERGPQLLPREDKDVADSLLDFLRLDGVDARLNLQVAQVEGSSGDSVRLALATSAGTSVLEGSDILVATGRIHVDPQLANPLDPNHACASFSRSIRFRSTPQR